jgi:hypothetical protein
MKNEEELVPELFSKKKKRTRKRSAGEHRDGWENLGERGVVRIDASPGGGITGVNVGGISGKGVPRVGRRLGSIGRAARRKFQKVSRDGDGDGKWTNPLTGEDDLPYNPIKKPVATAASAIKPITPEESLGQKRRKFLSDMENHVMRLATGGIDSLEVEIEDRITAMQLRGRVHYWNRPGTRDIKTSYNGNKFRAYASTGPKSGKKVTISGAMGSGPLRNETPYIGDEKLIEEQANQTQKFLRWKQNDDWKNFHIEHYDWWTFPIDKGSGPYGFMYDVSGEPLERLKQNQSYLASIRDAASAYMESLGWNMRTGWWIPNPRPDQKPNGNINQQRLFKIGRSLQIHELRDSFNSVRHLVETLKSNGVRVGNDEYWANPSKYTPRSRFKDSDGVAGRMAGISLQPTVFKGSPREFNPATNTQFRILWNGRDERNVIGDDSRGDLTFDWKNDNSRRDIIEKIWSGSITSGFANFGKLISPGRKHSSSSKKGLGEVLKDNLDLISNLGVHWTPAIGKNGYPGFRDQYGTLFTHSLTADNPDSAAGEQARDLLGHFAPTVNPREYWTRFESWLRNPFSTMRGANGNEVGVRLFYNDDREKLIAEFNKRITRLYEAFAEGFGYNPADKPFIPLPEHEKIDNFSQEDVLEYIRNQMNALINSPDLPMYQAPTVEALRKELIEYMSVSNPQSIDNLAPITSTWFEEYLKRNQPGYLKRTLNSNPNFLRRSLADDLDANKRRGLVEMMEIVLSYPGNENLSPKELKLSFFPEKEFTEEMIQEERDRQRMEIVENMRRLLGRRTDDENPLSGV